MSRTFAYSPSKRGKQRRRRRRTTATARSSAVRVGVGEETARRRRLRAPPVDSFCVEVEDDEAEHDPTWYII